MRQRDGDLAQSRTVCREPGLDSDESWSSKPLPANPQQAGTAGDLAQTAQCAAAGDFEHTWAWRNSPSLRSLPKRDRGNPRHNRTRLKTACAMHRKRKHVATEKVELAAQSPSAPPSSSALPGHPRDRTDGGACMFHLEQ